MNMLANNRQHQIAQRDTYALVTQYGPYMSGTGQRSEMAFGTKRPWVRIPPPRHHKAAGQEPTPMGFCSISGSDWPVQLRSTE